LADLVRIQNFLWSQWLNAVSALLLRRLILEFSCAHKGALGLRGRVASCKLTPNGQLEDCRQPWSRQRSRFWRSISRGAFRSARRRSDPGEDLPISGQGEDRTERANCQPLPDDDRLLNGASLPLVREIS